MGVFFRTAPRSLTRWSTSIPRRLAMLFKRIEAVTGPLAFLALLLLVAMLAQSVPPLPPLWRVLIILICLALIFAHVSFSYWDDASSRRPRETSDRGANAGGD